MSALTTEQLLRILEGVEDDDEFTEAMPLEENDLQVCYSFSD